MTNLGKILIALALVLGSLGALSFAGVQPFEQQTQHIAGDVMSNAQWFTGGYGFGSNSALYLSAKLDLPSGVNQAAWQNNTGSTVTIDMSRFNLTGIASTTFAVWVGTSTTPTVTNSFNQATAPFWSQLIGTTNTIATSTNGTYTTQLDNFVNHKSGYPAEIQVLNGQYLLLAVSASCITDGACNTATSTNRGWTGSLPFNYNYPGLH